jgi:S1-C subfamily serine protease
MCRSLASRRAIAAAIVLIAAAFHSRVDAAELVEVVKKVEGSVVRVDTDAGHGSGVILSADGVIATNYHVIDGARTVDIILRDGKKIPSTGYLAIDPSRDIAILRTAALPAGSAMQFSPVLPSVGEKVAAFGNPKGFSFTTSEGIVSATRTGAQVAEAIGKDEYHSIGYTVDTTWIQTTAPISPGNSGGPLVNMNSELVGLNTWSYSGQQLNFAVSLKEVRNLFNSVDSDTKAQNYDTLPRTRSTPIAGSWDSTLKPFRLELPTGRVFGFEVFRIGSGATKTKSRDEAGKAVVITHPNGALFAAAEQQNGILNGLTIAQYDNQEPMAHVTYAAGRRHGIMKTWDEAGEPLLFSQYAHGKRTGFTCLFDEGGPVLIIQYQADRIEYVQLMSYLTPLEGFTSEDAARQNPKVSNQLARITEIDAKLKPNEVEFRKQVKGFEMARRRELAAKLGPEKRARISERENSRRASENAFIQELRRRTHGF